MSDMKNVGFRLKVAQVYNAFLEDDIFKADDPATKQVVEEIRAFVNGRLEILMGIQAEAKAENALTPQEIAILKAIVAKVISGEEIDVEEEEEEATPPVLTQAQPVAPAPTKPGKPGKKVKPGKAAPPMKNGKEVLADGTEVFIVNGNKFVQVKDRDGNPLWKTNPENNQPVLENGKKVPLLASLQDVTKPSVGGGGFAPVQSPHQLQGALDAAAYAHIAAMGINLG